MATAKSDALALSADGQIPACSEDPMLKAIERHVWIVKLVMRACQSVAPVSAAALLWKLGSYLTGHHKHFLRHPTSRGTTLLNIWLAAETIFAVYCARVRAHGQKLYKPQPSTPAQRQEVFDRCLRTVLEPEDFATAWLGDAQLHELRRGNVEDWLSWAFFGQLPQQLTPAHAKEVSAFVHEFEGMTGRTLPPGHNGTVRALKFNVEPVQSAHRPLVYYIIAHGLLQRVAAPLAFAWLGFAPRQACGSFNYWIRRVAQPSQPPLVLIHGIGIGPLPYAELVHELLERGAKNSRHVVVLEVPAVAQQLAPPELTPDAFVKDFAALFEREQLPPSVLAGHSYGTMCLAWIAKELPHLASGMAFLDPGCFLLHHAKTLKAIVYKRASSDAEELFLYFMRSELHFNNHVRRHFLWERNLLFFEDIPVHAKTLVLLSEHDEIMPVEAINRVFQDAEGHAKWPHIKLLQLHGAIHGGILLDKGQRAQVVEEILKL